MTKTVLLVCDGVILAAMGIFAAAAQSTLPAKQPDQSTEAARLNNLGGAYMNQQLFEKALKAFEQAAAPDAKLQIAPMNQGIALFNLGRVDAARQLLEQAVKQNSTDPHGWYNLGLLEKNSGNSQAAVDAFRRVTEIDGGDADTWYFLGAAYAQNKQNPEAIDAFQHALKLNPVHASAEFGLSRAYQQSADLTHAREHLIRSQYITQNKLGSPISLAYGEQGKYSLAEESAEVVQKVPPQISVRFVDVTEQAGLHTKSSAASAKDLASYLGPGACFLDYDNDGRIDIFLPDNGKEGGMSLYRNLGNGKFEDVTRKAGLDPAMHAIGCTAGDYDNDGFSDLAVTTKDRVLLLHNEKNGAFKDMTEASGIKNRGFNVGVTLVDYDHDGDLDLYVMRYREGPGFDPRIENAGWAGSLSTENVMWRNNGNNTFSDVTSTTGLGRNLPSLAAVGTDFNNDRANDLVVTNGIFHPTIFENRREGEFAMPEIWPKES